MKALANMKRAERVVAAEEYVGRICRVTCCCRSSPGRPRRGSGRRARGRTRRARGRAGTGDLLLAPQSGTARWVDGDDRYSVLAIALANVGTIEPV